MSVSVFSSEFTFTKPKSEGLFVCLLVSVLIHSLLLFYVFIPTSRSASTRGAEQLIEVQLAPEAERRSTPKLPEQKPSPPALTLPKTQIVSPSEAPETEPPKETRLLSETNSRTEHQQIKRGLDGSRAPAERVPPEQRKTIPKPVTQSAQPANKNASKKASANSKLRLGAEELFDQFSAQAESKAETQTSEAQKTPEKSDSEYRPFSKNKALSFSGSIGSSDFLPDIPDGEMTLLNTKAERHAVFVRRVALQVFGELRRTGWQQVPFAQISRIQGFATVEAIMDATGKLLETRVLESSGSSSFDTTTEQSVRKGAWDQNPPVAAQAADGRIHFVFQARCWSRRSARSNTAALSEDRWLLLSTGLK